MRIRLLAVVFVVVPMFSGCDSVQDDLGPDRLQNVLLLDASLDDDGRRHLYTLSPEGGDPRRISDRRGVSLPSVSPDGKRIVYTSPGLTAPWAALQVVTVDGQSHWQLGALLGYWDRVYGANIFGSYPDWAPTGDKIVVQYCCEAGANAYDLYVVDLADSSYYPLVDSDEAQERRPVWSPDGQEVLFLSNQHQTDERRWKTELYVVRADGTGLRRVTQTGDKISAGGTWSPDGARIAYVEDSERLVIATRDGEPVKSFDLEHPTGSVQWSPDGERFVIVSMPNPRSSPERCIRMVDATDGTETTLLCTDQPVYVDWVGGG